MSPDISHSCDDPDGLGMSAGNELRATANGAPSRENGSWASAFESHLGEYGAKWRLNHVCVKDSGARSARRWQTKKDPAYPTRQAAYHQPLTSTAAHQLSLASIVLRAQHLPEGRRECAAAVRPARARKLSENCTKPSRTGRKVGGNVLLLSTLSDDTGFGSSAGVLGMWDSGRPVCE
jgi:hypothetical protein